MSKPVLTLEAQSDDDPLTPMAGFLIFLKDMRFTGSWDLPTLDRAIEVGETIVAQSRATPQAVSPTEGKFIAEWRTQAEIEAGVPLDGTRSEGLTERLRSPVFGTPTTLQAATAIETWKARAERLADMHRDMCVVAGEATARAETAEATISVLLRRLAEVEKAEPASRLRAVSQP